MPAPQPSNTPVLGPLVISFTNLIASQVLPMHTVPHALPLLLYSPHALPLLLHPPRALPLLLYPPRALPFLLFSLLHSINLLHIPLAGDQEKRQFTKHCAGEQGEQQETLHPMVRGSS